jgi:hypothetical protein
MGLEQGPLGDAELYGVDDHGRPQREGGGAVHVMPRVTVHVNELELRKDPRRLVEGDLADNCCRGVNGLVLLMGGAPIVSSVGRSVALAMTVLSRVSVKPAGLGSLPGLGFGPPHHRRAESPCLGVLEGLAHAST